MLNKKIEDICNRQVEREGFSSSLYLAMASWAETNGFSGVAEWLYSQSNEERLHMLKFIKYINERGVQANKVYNSIPQMNHLNITQEKEIVPNEPLADRINPIIVDAFKENPYTQPLDSWA